MRLLRSKDWGWGLKITKARAKNEMKTLLQFLLSTVTYGAKTA